MLITTADGRAIDCADEAVHEGGEAKIYLTKDQKSVVKLYHSESQTRRKTLDSIIGPLNAVSGANSMWRDYLCWPESIVIQPGLGVVMPRVPDDLKKLDWFLGPKARERLSQSERGSWDSHILIAMRIARAVRRLHQLGLCHSDLSANNCMANARDGRTRLIDMDGLVVPGLLPPSVQGTGGYMAPEIVERQASPSISTDLHALAVLIYQVLLFRHPLKGPKYHAQDPALDDQLAYGREALYIEHPSDSSNRPPGAFVSSKTLGPKLAGLMEQAFTAGLRNPSARPQATQWEEALGHLYDSFLPCTNTNCQMMYFAFSGGQPLRCPWCGTRWSASPTIAILDLYHPVTGRQGQYSPDHHQIVAWRGRQLFEWHAMSGRSPGLEANTSPVARFEYDSKRKAWLIRNQSSGSFVALGPNQPQREVRPMEEVVLTDELRLLLGPAKNDARCAYVRLVRVTDTNKG